jgi:hypothetical protein
MNIICYISCRYFPYTKEAIERKLHDLGINLDRLNGAQSKRRIYYIVEEDGELYLYNDLPNVDLDFHLFYPIDGRIFKIPTEIIKYMVSISKSKSVKCFLINVAACKGDGGFDWEENPWMRWDDIITKGDYSSFYNSTTDTKALYLSVDTSNKSDWSTFTVTNMLTSVSSEENCLGKYLNQYKTLTNLNIKENENRLQEKGSTILRGSGREQGGVCSRRHKVAIRVKPISHKEVIGRG